MSIFSAKQLNNTRNIPEDESWAGKILNEIQEVVWSVDASTQEVLYLNSAAERIYGRRASDFYDNPDLWLEVIHPEERDRARHFLGTALLTGSGEVEYGIIRPSGEVLDVQNKAWVIKDDLGKAIRIDGIITEMQARKRTTEHRSDPVKVLLVDDPPIIEKSVRRMQATEKDAELVSCSALFSSFFGAASAGLVILDDQLRYVTINETLAEMNGLPVAEHIGKTVSEVLPQVAIALEPIFRNILATGEPIINYEISGQTHSQPGVVRTWMASWFPIQGANRELIGVGGVVIEITDRKQAEAAMLSSEARNRAFVEALPDMLFRLSKDGTYLDFKAPNESDLAVLPSELLGKKVASVLPFDVAQLILHHITLALSKRQLQVFEYQLTPLHGVACDFEVRMAAIGSDEVLLIVRDISDRKQAEAALRRSERQFRAIFNSMFQFIGVLQPDGTVLEINQTALDFGGIRAEDIVGRPFWSGRWWTISPESQNQLKNAIALAATGEFVRYEVDLLSAENAIVTIDFSLKPVFDSCQKVVLIIPEGRDITEVNRAREALRISEERLNLALSATDNGLWDWNVVTGEVYFSPRWIEMLGYDLNEISGHASSWERLVNPDDLPKVMQALNQHFEDAKFPYAVDHRLRTKSGEWKWILTQGKVVERDRNGKPVRMVGTHKDVGDRKRTEEALRLIARNLQSAQRIAHIGNWEFDIATGKLAWSEELFRIFGLDPAVPEPTFSEHLQQIHPDDRKLYQQTVGRAIAEGRSYEMDVRILRPDGELRYINARGEALRNESGQVLRLVGTAMDITDRKQAEATLGEQEQFLRTIYEGVDQHIFVADVLEMKEEDGRKKEEGREEGAKLEPSSFFPLSSGFDFRYAGWNPILEGVIGISSSLGYGKTPEEVFGAVVGAKLRQLYTDCLVAGTSINRENCSTFEGVESWWLTTLNPLRNESGRIYRIIGTSGNITERKQAEKALQEQEQFLRSIYEGVDYGIGVFDVLEGGEFRYASFNPAMARISPIPMKPLLGKTLTSAFPPEMATQVRQRLLDCIEAGTTISFEDCYHMGGKITWWIASMTPLRNAQSEIYQVVITSINITERKQAELALQRSEAQLRELAQREALLNRLATQIRNSLDLNTILDNTVQAIRNVLQIDRCHFAWYKPNLSGWEVTNEAKTTTFPSVLGCYPSSILGLLSEKNVAGEIVRVDELATLDEPIPRQFLIDRGYTSLLNVPVKTRYGKVGVIVCVHCSGERPWRDGEVELLTAVSEQLAIAINFAELYTQSQETAAIAQAQSVQLSQTLQELQRTQTQLIQTEKMSSLGQMVAGVAHEINNPVNFIFGNLIHAGEYIGDILKIIKLYRNAYPQPTPEIQEEIETIDLDYVREDLPMLLNSMKVGAERIREIVKSLRTFSRLDEAEMKSVDIHENIDSTLMILQNRLKGGADCSAIAVIKDYGHLPLVECYAGQLNQVFMNLLSNAIDALEERDKGRSLEKIKARPSNIRISTGVRDRKWIQIRIADNGIGMTQEVISRIFDPFYTTKPVGKGTGLGLSISYQIVVEKHRGSLRCVSKLGQGAEFIIEIPQQQLP